MIAKAAVKIMDLRQNKEVIVPCHRHSDVFQILYTLGYKKLIDYHTIAEGFLDENDVFLDRHHAWLEAVRSKQLMVIDNSCKELYSEDLW